MGLSLAQLTQGKSLAQMQQIVLDCLQGRGVVTKFGVGTGTVTLSGTPTAAAQLIIYIQSDGEPGTATFWYSLDNGTTWSSIVTVPSGASAALGATGVSATFNAGPTGAGTSFLTGDYFTATLSTPNFAATSWQDGSVPKTLVEVESLTLADLTQLIANVARGGFATTQPGVTGAAGAWLDLVGQNVYNLTRNPAGFAAGTCTLSDPNGAGPFTIAVGQLWIVAANGLRYNNTTGGVLPANGTLALSWQAESPGAAYNVANGANLSLVTSLPGVELLPFAVTTQGVDSETDVAYATRCQGRWAALGTGSPAAAYDSWARTASAEVTRTKVIPDGVVAGQVDVYLAGASGPVSDAAVTAVTNYITPRVPICSTLDAQKATALAIAVAGTVYVAKAYLTSAQGQVLTNLGQLIQVIAIGGTVYIDAFREQIMLPAGVRNCPITLNGGTVDIALDPTQVATLDTTGLSFVGV